MMEYPSSSSRSLSDVIFPASLESEYVESSFSKDYLFEVFESALKKYVNARLLMPGLISESLLTSDDEERIKARNKDDVTMVEDLLTFLKNDEKCPDHEGTFHKKLCRALEISDCPAHHYILKFIFDGQPLPAHQEHHEEFIKRLNKVRPEFTQNVKVTDFLNMFGDIISKDDEQKIRKIELHHSSMDACSQFLFCLFRSPGDWPQTLINALKCHGSLLLVEKLERNDLLENAACKSDIMDINSGERSLSGAYASLPEARDEAGQEVPLNSFSKQFSEPGVSTSTSFEANILFAENTEFRTDKEHLHKKKRLHAADTNQFDILDYENSPTDETSDDKMELRDYQQELVQPALEGKNTVIVAPTGSGKTYTAGEIIRKHFHMKQKKKNGRPLKVLFIVEKRNLADQQTIELEKFLEGKDGNLNVQKVTGETRAMSPMQSLNRYVKEVDIIVLTAGVMMDSLKEGGPDCVPLTDFSLLIFDECHHALARHNFNLIMRAYRQEKKQMQELGEATHDLPQIIGLTASLGTGKAKSHVQAVDHALQVCANLDADCVKTVEKHKESLDKLIKKPKEMEPIIIEPRYVDPFADKVIALITHIEERLMTLKGAREFITELYRGQKDSKGYEQWVVNHKNNTCPTQITDGTIRRPIMTCLEHLLDYNKGLLLNRDAQAQDAYHFLFTQNKDREKNKANFQDIDWEFSRLFYDAQNDLEKISKDPRNENPLLKELRVLLKKEYTTKPDSLGLLFTVTKESTDCLRNWISKTPEFDNLIRPSCMTSETSEPQRENIIQKFRSMEENTYNLLVVTSVVEEGLNVPQCNLVFRLNYVPSDVGSIQVKGRNRAPGGKSFLVCYGEHQEHNLLNKIWEMMMDKALTEINHMTHEAFMQKMKKFQDQDDRLRRQEDAKRQLADLHKGEEEWKLHCKKCDVEACSSFDIKCFKGSHHYVPMQEFIDEKVKFKPHKKPKRVDETFKKLAKIHCDKCELDWGLLAILEGYKHGVIKAESFVFKKVATGSEVRAKRVVGKKWKEAPFKVVPVEHVEEELIIDYDIMDDDSDN